MQSAARKLKRISSGQQNDNKRHNNRKATRGRRNNYVHVMPKVESIEIPDTLIRKMKGKVVNGKRTYMNVKRKISKALKEKLYQKELLNHIKKAINTEERMKDIQKIIDWVPNPKRKLQKRPTVESSIYLLKQRLKQRAIHRTVPIRYGNVPNFA